MQLTEAENGQTVTVRPGDLIELRLPENPTTGYRWQVEVEAGVTRVADPELPREAAVPEPPPVVGGGGVRVIRFRAGEPGAGRLELKRWRPFEGEKSVTDRFVVTVEITDR